MMGYTDVALNVMTGHVTKFDFRDALAIDLDSGKDAFRQWGRTPRNHADLGSMSQQEFHALLDYLGGQSTDGRFNAIASDDWRHWTSKHLVGATVCLTRRAAQQGVKIPLSLMGELLQVAKPGHRVEDILEATSDSELIEWGLQQERKFKLVAALIRNPEVPRERLEKYRASKAPGIVKAFAETGDASDDEILAAIERQGWSVVEGVLQAPSAASPTVLEAAGEKFVQICRDRKMDADWKSVNEILTSRVLSSEQLVRAVATLMKSHRVNQKRSFFRGLEVTTELTVSVGGVKASCTMPAWKVVV